MRAFVVLVFMATPVLSMDLDETQTKAVGVLTPMLSAQLPEDQAGMIAECMVTTAKKREVRQIAKADPAAPGEKITALSNKVIARKEVMTCMTEKLAPK